ncbi:MAG TPA: peroxiredoxin [Candidatus Latescibacteria bacterium]|nr:peroxiredoxin [Candidatus Latescibacterota bacterium]HOF60217.1 peroxiredoxin [Candidatus Latescibacterota bacterium]HOS63499.1 peroxiredoxin [Candidatus Latescibacterota bacterium]HPK73248.1 peroxiredoxin [Candidatus Latescibacterota bacterium]
MGNEKDCCEDQPVGLVRINEPAPEFEAVTTHGVLKLSDFKGKWVVLFSHPADFTPVCTTEFMAFANHQEEFDKRGVQLIGLSIDSVHSHIAWVRSIESLFGVKVKFPVIADLDMKVANAFGLIHPKASTTSAVRAVFVMDPDQLVKAIIYYPLTTGRSIPEIIRLIDALQINAAKKVATPEGWKPGDKVIVPPPATTQAAEERMKATDMEVVDWYFSKKSV